MSWVRSVTHVSGLDTLTVQTGTHFWRDPIVSPMGPTFGIFLPVAKPTNGAVALSNMDLDSHHLGGDDGHS